MNMKEQMHHAGPRVLFAACLLLGGFDVVLADGPIIVIDGAARPEIGKTLTGACSREGVTFSWERIDEFCKKKSVIVSEAAEYVPGVADLEHWLKVTAWADGMAVGSAKVWFSKLPVLYLTTDDGQGVTSKEEYKSAHLRIQGNAEFKEQYDGITEIKGHGTSSWRTFEQKAYKLKLDAKTDLFGFGKNKHWILISNYIDTSLMRNRSASELAKELGVVGMDMTWVVCVINGKYDGVRMLAEQVRVDRNRVNITDWESEAEGLADALCEALKGAGVWTKDAAKANKNALETQMSENFTWVSTGTVTFGGVKYRLADYGLKIPELNGGFLLKLEEKANEESSSFVSRKGVEISFKNPEMAATEPKLVAAAQRIWQDFEDAVCSTDGFNADGQHYADLADMDSMVGYWLTLETLGNIDGWRRSRFAYVDHGKKLTFGPVWDFDAGSGAFGTVVFGLAALPNHWAVVSRIGTPCRSGNNFFREWLDDPLFCLKAYALYWEKVRPWMFLQIAECGVIDRRMADLAEAGAAHSARFGSIINLPFASEVANFRAYLTKRIEWFDRQFSNVDTLVRSTRTVLSEEPYCKGDGKLALKAVNGTDIGAVSSTDFEFVGGADATFAVTVSCDALLKKNKIASIKVCVNGIKLGVYPVSNKKVTFTVPAAKLVSPVAAGRSLVTIFGLNAKGDVMASNYATVLVGRETPGVWAGETADWMKFIPDGTALGNITMPASHDSAMVDGLCQAICPLPQAFEGLFANQDLTIGQQLVAGARCFDLRPWFVGDELRSSHTTFVDKLGLAAGGTGLSFRQIFEETASFLEAHPSEVVFFGISKWGYGFDKETGDRQRAAVRALMDEFGAVIYRWAGENACPGINAIRLSDDIRGKLICLWSDSNCDPRNGIWGYGNRPAANGNLAQTGHWSNTRDLMYLLENQLEQWSVCQGVDPVEFAFSPSWQLTWQLDLLDLANSNRKLASMANPMLPDFLAEGIRRGYPRPMFVQTDYVNADTSRVIISYNFGDPTDGYALAAPQVVLAKPAQKAPDQEGQPVQVVGANAPLTGMPEAAKPILAVSANPVKGQAHVPVCAQEGLKPWAVGTFDGGGEAGVVKLKISGKGKISGKWMSGGTNWTLSASSLEAYDSVRGAYYATLVAKRGRARFEAKVELTEDGLVCRSAPASDAADDTVLFCAWRNVWREAPWKAVAKKLRGRKMTIGDSGNLMLMIGSNGAVTVRGSFEGLNGRPYLARCSSVLIQQDESGFAFRIYLHFPPRVGRFEGLDAELELLCPDACL